MKRKNWICLFLSVLLILTGCGGNTAGNAAAPEELYDIEVTEEIAELPLQRGEALRGAQYFKGERIWLIGNSAGQVFCYHEEKGERELLLEHIPAVCIGHMLYRTEENFYAYNKNRLTVLDLTGEEVKTVYAEGRITKLCETRGGGIVLAVEAENGAALKMLDIKNGILTGDCMLTSCLGIAAGVEQEVLVIDWDGVYDIDMESGEKSWHMKWYGTSYAQESRFWYAARMGEDGSLEQIESESLDDNFYVVRLRKINPVEMGKTILIFKSLYAVPSLKSLIARFNKENKEYHVVLQDSGDESIQDFLAHNDMEIATGKGPDLIARDAVTDMRVLAEKGGLENLEPYLAQDGIDMESYHRETFQSQGMENGIYSAGYAMYISNMYIKEGFVDSNGQADIKTFLDNLESYDGQAVLGMGYDSVNILHHLFEMSDNLYGMVDWDQKTCDFSGELWEQMLRVAKQYGLTERNGQWEEIMNFGGIQSFQFMVFNERNAKENDMVLTGYPSENGMVQELWIDSVAINADSAHKDGAWEFLRFLLDEENQKLLTAENLDIPVHEGVLRESVREYLEAYADTYSPTGAMIIRPEIPEGTEEKFWECLENAKPEPYRTAQVIAIIKEEAALYFTGDKTVEEVSDVIENRVRLYLAELE